MSNNKTALAKEYINEELSKLNNLIVATPTEEALSAFTKANGGSMDEVLKQMSLQYGYKLALENVLDELNAIHK